MKLEITEVHIRERDNRRLSYETFSQRSNRINKKPRVYFHLSEETLLENLVNRKSRPYKQFRELLPEIKQLFPVGTRFRWSQKAGCSCPCSPGFIADGGFNFDVHVTYKVIENEQ